MLIGSMQIELFIPASVSLKEKRFILKSIKTKIQNKFNVSIAEIDYLDKWQRSCLGVACVSNERKFLDKVLNGVVKVIENENRVEIIDQLIEVL